MILMEFDPDQPDLPVTYWYTDIYVITAIALEKLTRGGPTVTAANSLRDDLPNRELTEKISVAKGLFVKVAAPSNLLPMLSLQSPERINWQNRVILAGQELKWGPRPEMLPDVLAKRISEIPETIKQACGHDAP